MKDVYCHYIDSNGDVNHRMLEIGFDVYRPFDITVKRSFFGR